MLDEPVGLHQGGSVAAPLFNLIAEAALSDYLVLPDDKSFRESLVKLSKKYETESGSEQPEGDQTITERGGQPSRVADRTQAGKSASGNPRPEMSVSSNMPSPLSSLRQSSKPAGSSKNSVPEGIIVSGIMPDFRGRGIRAVMQGCSELNLKLRLYGSGVAVRQTPAPGARVKSGDECKIEFQ
jgi:hypothetical protein